MSARFLRYLGIRVFLASPEVLSLPHELNECQVKDGAVRIAVAVKGKFLIRVLGGGSNFTKYNFWVREWDKDKIFA